MESNITVRPQRAKTNTKSVTLALLFVLVTFASHRTLGNHQQDTAIVDSTVPMEPQDISPLLIGEKLPAGKLTITQPTILVFYRGGWCPYCVKHLAQLERIKPDLEKAGYRIVAVSTDSPENLEKTRSKEKLTIDLVSDADLSLARAMGIAYKAPAVYHKFLPETSGGKNRDNLLPVPSVFILNQSGLIQCEHINPDFKQRMDPKLLKAFAEIIAGQSGKQNG